MPKTDRPEICKPLAAVLTDLPLRAAGFIVTIYGDAIIPRGGEVSMGTLIETCASVGISETLVRTAVSRLVANGQLEGWRRGRRSFYRLTEQAQADFDTAAELIYGPPDPWDWRFVLLPETRADTLMPRLERKGFARIKGPLAVGPARVALPKEVIAFEASLSAFAGAAGDQLADFVAATWDLVPHAAAYADLLARFGPVEDQAAELSGANALTMRLLLVHLWRNAVLRDPRLPQDALPANWPGHAARALFNRLYRRLSPAADSHIGVAFEGVDGPIAPFGEVGAHRATLLAQSEKTGRDQEFRRS